MRRRGFTLLELILVLSIVGILLAVVGPRFAAIRDRSSVRAATNEVAGAFSAARQAAITHRTAVAVVIDTANGAVEVRSGSRPVLRRSLRVIYGIVLGSNRDSAVYDPRGLGFGVSNLSITVRRGAVVDTLSMSRLGRVRW